jgi:tetrahydromethanopterin S-methyltransferase subunit A
MGKEIKKIRSEHMGKPKNIPYIHKVKINATSKERYERFVEIVKMMIIEDIKREMEEERKDKLKDSC